jgi:hypothetical protein
VVCEGAAKRKESSASSQDDIDLYGEWRKSGVKFGGERGESKAG